MSDPPDTLDSALRDHYAAQSLSPAMLAKLKGVARPQYSRMRMRLTYAWRFAAAAGLLIAATFAWQSGQRQRAVELSQDLAADAYWQHKQFVSDVDAEDFDQLQGRMPKLGFKPIEPQRCKQDDYRVVGARYATLAGHPAAQIRLAYVEGPQMSLYELPASALPNVRPGTTEIGGTPVTVWQENGLLMALAGTPAE